MRRWAFIVLLIISSSVRRLLSFIKNLKIVWKKRTFSWLRKIQLWNRNRFWLNAEKINLIQGIYWKLALGRYFFPQSRFIGQWWSQCFSGLFLGRNITEIWKISRRAYVLHRKLKELQNCILCSISVWSLFGSVRLYISLHFLPMILVKLVFHLSLF